jgi:hypothetical protein
MIKDFQERKIFKNKIKLLPNWEKVLEYSDKALHYEYYTRVDECLLDAFKWDDTPEGGDYWAKIYKSIKTVKYIKCCDKWTRGSDTAQHMKCNTCHKEHKTQGGNK